LKLLNPINRLLFSFRKQKSDNKLGKVLVVSNTGFGDTILSTPAIKSLRRSFPNERLIFLVNKKFSALFTNYKYVNTIWEYTGSYINLFSIIFRCKNEKIHTIFLFHSNGPEDIFFSLLSGAKNIYKMTENANHEYRALFLNSANKKVQHHIEKKIDLIRFFKPKLIDTTLTIAAEFYFKQPVNYFTTNRKVIGIQLGTQDVYKIWPVERVIRLSELLLLKKYYLVFFGATTLELGMMKKVENSINSNNILNLVGKTKISELPGKLKQLDLLVTNDTGILHLAIAMKVKSLSLFSPTSSEEFGAYQDKELHHSIQKDGFFVNTKPKKQRTQDGMQLISVEEVFSKIQEVV